jgi:hypothetical protein
MEILLMIIGTALFYLVGTKIFGKDNAIKLIISIAPAICYWIIYYYYQQVVQYGFRPSKLILLAWVIGIISFFLAHYKLQKEGNKFIWIIVIVGIYLGWQTIPYWKALNFALYIEMMNEGPIGQLEAIYFNRFVDRLGITAIVVNLVNYVSVLWYCFTKFKRLKYIVAVISIMYLSILGYVLKITFFTGEFALEQPGQVVAGEFKIDDQVGNKRLDHVSDPIITGFMQEFDIIDPNSVGSIIYDINNDGSDEIVVYSVKQTIEEYTPVVLGIFDKETGEKIVAEMIYDDVSGFADIRLISNPTYGNCIAILTQYRANAADIFTLLDKELIQIDEIVTYGELSFNEFVKDIDADGYEEFIGREPENRSDDETSLYFSEPYYNAIYKWDSNEKIYVRTIDKDSSHESKGQVVETNEISETNPPAYSEDEAGSMQVEPLNLETDFNVAGIFLFDTKKQVIEVLGHPEKSETKDANYSILYYTFGEIGLRKMGEDEKVESIKLCTSDITGPRAIKVGDSVESVIKKFPNEKYIKDGDSQILYKEQANIKLPDGTE